MTDIAFAIEPEGGVVAIMPGEAGTVNRPDTCTCYASMGGHSSGCIDYFTDHCRQASYDESNDLRIELGRRGYDICVISISEIDGDDYLAERLEQLG